MSLDSERPLQGLTYDSSGERLRAACHWAGVVLLVVPVLPFQSIEQQPVFLWEILGELHPATAVAALWPTLSGALLLAASRLVKQPSLLARLTLLVLGTWSLVAALGAEAAAWDFAALPESLSRRIEPYVLSIALSGAALRLQAEPAARRAGSVVAGLSVISGLGFGLWPGEGEAPLQTCLRFAGMLLKLPDPRLVLGYGLILAIAVCPLIAAGTALSLSLAGRSRHTALFAELTTFGAPAIVLAVALQRVLATFGDTSVVVTSAVALALAAVLALSERALELTALWLTGLGQSSDRESAPAPRRALALSFAAAVVAIAVVFVLSRPVAKGIAWRLGPRSDQAERVFGELLPKWALSRARWTLAAQNSASAAELAEARADGNQLLRAARDVNPELGRAVAELIEGAGELDLAGRRWFRLLESVNEVSRKQGLPYYVDPSLSAGMHAGHTERLFLVHPYRVEAVRPARADGVDYALLGVRRLGDARDGHARLGFSRDVQPFALVVLDEVEPYAASLSEQAARDSQVAKLGPTLAHVRRLVERHELQHQIDGPALTHAPAVLAALAGYSHAAIDEVNRELSAYLAELVADGVSPKLALVHVMPFRDGSPGSGLRFIVELELAALSERKSAESADLSASFDELMALPDDVLRKRARAAHEHLFDAELPDAKF